MSELERRQDIRLPDFDYSLGGAYFVTLCTKDRRRILSSIVNGVGAGVPDRPECILTEAGKICEKQISDINEHYSHVNISKYVIMPDHIHMLIVIENGRSRTPAPTANGKANAVVPSLISTFKRFVNKQLGENIWQRSYYDHVIRGEKDYLETWQYIESNPSSWLEKNYIEQ